MKINDLKIGNKVKFKYWGIQEGYVEDIFCDRVSVHFSYTSDHKGMTTTISKEDIISKLEPITVIQYKEIPIEKEYVAYCDKCKKTFLTDKYVIADKIYTCEKCQKPPIGLRPDYVNNTSRQKEILEACGRYIQVRKQIPSEWIKEFEELNNKNKP